MLDIQLIENIPYEAEELSLKKNSFTLLRSVVPAIGFVREAALTLHFSSLGKKIISKGQFFLLPRDFPCQIHSEEDQRLLLLKIPNITAIYIHFMLPVPKSDIGSFKELFYPLDMAENIHRVIDSIGMYRVQKMDTSQLLGLKVFELFYFINYYYPEDLIRLFFTPILTKEYTFALFVLSNYSLVKNAEELAHLSNYTFSGFDKQFRKVFGTAPYRWMLQKKVNKIYLEIYATSKPIKVIAEEFGFTNSSHLGDFCRKHMGLSPALIRKKEIG